jgi:hypothetical protein
MVKKVMTDLLDQYTKQAPSDLQMLGVKKMIDADILVVSFNHRPLGVCDPDHGCCMQYPILERATGGSKGLLKDLMDSKKWQNRKAKGNDSDSILSDSSSYGENQKNGNKESDSKSNSSFIDNESRSDSQGNARP